MIFYFTATGNSQYAAEIIAEAIDTRLVSIGQALRDGHYDFDITKDDYVGFVIPTFAWTLPGAVARFIENLTIKGYSNQFVFAVFTCGESSGDESAALYTLLRAKSITFSGSFDLVMPDNFIIWSAIPAPIVLETILDSAENALVPIIEAIKAKKSGIIDARVPKNLSMPLESISTGLKTSKFYAEDSCTACGVCMTVCPMRCIKSDDQGRPIWEGTCTMCLSCLHRCPTAAIQYGNETANKGRYINPRVTFQ